MDIVICDKNPKFITGIESKIKACCQAQNISVNIAHYTKEEEFLENLGGHKYHLAFIDTHCQYKDIKIISYLIQNNIPGQCILMSENKEDIFMAYQLNLLEFLYKRDDESQITETINYIITKINEHRKYMQSKIINLTK